jgi:hypothetical protein
MRGREGFKISRFLPFTENNLRLVNISAKVMSLTKPDLGGNKPGDHDIIEKEN